MGLYLGCPMWGLKTWAGNFFPAGAKQREFLSLYSRRLNTVEGNTTFYALPDIGTLERWRDDTPADFKFCLKVPQSISHQRKLIGAGAETAAFIDRLQRLGARCGPSFLQLPPTFGARQLPALAAYLDAWPREFALAVEPRHADFFGPAEAEFDGLLRARNMQRGIFDTTALFALPGSHSSGVSEAQERKPKFAFRDSRTGPFSFVRFVGQPEVEANLPWLNAWAERAAAWLSAGDDCYFFFHCPDDTDAPRLAHRFHELLSQRISLPELPVWDEPVQGTLF